jgi:serine O-acetyltransferase
VLSDLRKYRPDQEPSVFLFVKTLATTPGLVASSIMRTQQTLNRRGWERTARTLRHVTLALGGLDFAPGAEVGPGLLMHHPHGIVIGGGAVVGAHCTLLQNVTLGERYLDGRPPHLYPEVGDGVTIGAGACVLGGVRVGDGALIGANTVVLSDVPAGCIAVGSPARILDTESKRRFA